MFHSKTPNYGTHQVREGAILFSAAGCLAAGILYWDEALANVPTEAGTVDTGQVSAAADRHGSWHGQCGQDYVIAATYAGARAHYFVDLAANDPVIISKTRALERDLGWTGICVDANPSLLQQLARRRACTVGAGPAPSSAPPCRTSRSRASSFILALPM